MPSQDLNKTADARPASSQAFRRAMALRRWFLILAVPVVFALTLFAVGQWRWLWGLLLP